MKREDVDVMRSWGCLQWAGSPACAPDQIPGPVGIDQKEGGGGAADRRTSEPAVVDPDRVDPTRPTSSPSVR